MFEDLYKWDLIEKIKPLLYPSGTYHIQPETGKIYNPDDSRTIIWDTPWYHIRQDRKRFCRLYQEVFVGCLKVLPARCVECWKVVFRPQYLKDMLALIGLMQGLSDKHGFACKLGSEQRPWTSGEYGKSGLWGCYFYNNSKEDGTFCYEKVKEALSKNKQLRRLLEDVDSNGLPKRLVLKRGCTEFEVGYFGDSQAWSYTDEARQWEEIVNSAFEVRPETRQPEFVRKHVIVEWFKHAHHAGDPTVKELNSGDPLWRTTRFYHHELNKEV